MLISIEATKALAEQATTGFEYLTDLIQAREQHPRNDLISALITERSGRHERNKLYTAMLPDGRPRVNHRRPGQRPASAAKKPRATRTLRNHPALMPRAVQEMFRFEAPLPFFHRYANQTVEVMGQSYPAGTKFGLLYGSANRDPLQFDDADQFRIDRSANRLCIRQGAHLCLGNHLSRIDMEVIFKTLLERVRRIELLQEPTYRTGLASRGLIELNIALTPN